MSNDTGYLLDAEPEVAGEERTERRSPRLAFFPGLRLSLRTVGHSETDLGVVREAINKL